MRTTRTDPIAGGRGRDRDRLPLSTFIVVMLWSIPAFGMLMYRFGGEFGDIDIFEGPELPLFGAIVVAGWLMIALWLTNGKGLTNGKIDPTATKRDDWLTLNRWLCAVLVAAVVMMIFTVHQFTPELSFVVAAVILWTTLGAIAPVLHRQLTGQPIRHRPDLCKAGTDPTSSLGVRGLLVLTFCIAAAIGTARRMSGGDLIPLYPAAAMGMLGGLVWLSMVLSTIGRKHHYLPVAVVLTIVEATAAGQWLMLSPAIDSTPVEAVILFIISARVVGWVYLSVMRASGYCISSRS